MPQDPDIFGRKLSQEKYVERIVDIETGEEFINEGYRETKEDPDGRIQSISSRSSEILFCGHHRKPGEPLVKCEKCTEEAKRVAYVCTECSVLCPICGKSLCRKHSRPLPDGKQRYCRKCHKKAKRALKHTLNSSEGQAHKSLAKRLLEWW